MILRATDTLIKLKTAEVGPPSYFQQIYAEWNLLHSLFGLFHFRYKGVWLVFNNIIFIEIPVFNANSVDPDQTPRSVASDLGLHCLPMSLLWDARLKWVTIVQVIHVFHFLWDHWAHCGIFENRVLLMSTLEGVSAFTNSITAYEESQ